MMVIFTVVCTTVKNLNFYFKNNSKIIIIYNELAEEDMLKGTKYMPFQFPHLSSRSKTSKHFKMDYEHLLTGINRVL